MYYAVEIGGSGHGGDVALIDDPFENMEAGQSDCNASGFGTGIITRFRRTAEKAHHRHLGLLRARREWPPGCRAADKRDELATPHTEHGSPPPRSVYRTLNLPKKGRQVLGTDLNCSD
jgi:hypothetical protein